MVAVIAVAGCSYRWHGIVLFSVRCVLQVATLGGEESLATVRGDKSGPLPNCKHNSQEKHRSRGVDILLWMKISCHTLHKKS